MDYKDLICLETASVYALDQTQLTQWPTPDAGLNGRVWSEDHDRYALVPEGTPRIEIVARWVTYWNRVSAWHYAVINENGWTPLMFDEKVYDKK